MFVLVNSLRRGSVSLIAAALGGLTLVTTGCMSDGAPPRVQLFVGPSIGELSLSFALEARGTGSASVGALELSGNVGTMEIDGRPYTAFVYTDIPAYMGELALYQGLAVSSSDLAVFWLYCRDGTLEQIYVETTGGLPLLPEAAFGDCSAPFEATARPLELPAIELNVELAPSIAIEGERISIEVNGEGVVEIDGTPLSVTVFETVDCSRCSDVGWWELHAILQDENAERLIFGIFYLHLNEESSSRVNLSYTFALPELASPFTPLSFIAEWTAP